MQDPDNGLEFHSLTACVLLLVWFFQIDHGGKSTFLCYVSQMMLPFSKYIEIKTAYFMHTEIRTLPNWRLQCIPWFWR